jgi:hypothetical protein
MKKVNYSQVYYKNYKNKSGNKESMQKKKTNSGFQAKSEQHRNSLLTTVNNAPRVGVQELTEVNLDLSIGTQGVRVITLSIEIKPVEPKVATRNEEEKWYGKSRT